MQRLTGADGELVERLVALVEDDGGSDDWWLDVGRVVADSVGGCDDVVPESGRRGADGAVAWEHLGEREVVSRRTWMNRIRVRLAMLVDEGVAEDFLVRSLRDEITRSLAGPAHGAGGDHRESGGAERSRYDQWIAEQASSGDNLELSIVARALLAPTGAVDLTSGDDGLAARWAAASTAIDDGSIDAWRGARAGGVTAPPPGT